MVLGAGPIKGPCYLTPPYVRDPHLRLSRTAKQRFSGQAELDEKTVDEALKDVRTALLEADVGYDVVQDFCKNVKEKATGVIVKLKATSNKKAQRVTPIDHFVKICHDELVALMGPIDTSLKFVKKGPTGIMVVGLQGSGKTTSCGKLALYLPETGQKALAGRCGRVPPRRDRAVEGGRQQAGRAGLQHPGQDPPGDL